MQCRVSCSTEKDGNHDMTKHIRMVMGVLAVAETASLLMSCFAKMLTEWNAILESIQQSQLTGAGVGSAI